METELVLLSLLCLQRGPPCNHSPALTLLPFCLRQSVGVFVADTDHNNVTDEYDWYFCSGAAVGPHQILTAAHCLWDRTTNDWRNMTGVRFCLGLNDAVYNCEYSVGTFTSLHVHAQYKNLSNPDHASWDYGLVQTSGSPTSWLSWAAYEPANSTASFADNNTIFVVGYHPADLPGYEMQEFWTTAISFNEDTVRFHDGVTPGSSGCPVITFRQDLIELPGPIYVESDYYFLGAVNSWSICDTNVAGTVDDQVTYWCTNTLGDNSFLDTSYNVGVTMNNARICDVCDWSNSADRSQVCDMQACGYTTTSTTTTTL